VFSKRLSTPFGVVPMKPGKVLQRLSARMQCGSVAVRAGVRGGECAPRGAQGATRPASQRPCHLHTRWRRRSESRLRCLGRICPEKRSSRQGVGSTNPPPGARRSREPQAQPRHMTPCACHCAACRAAGQRVTRRMSGSTALTHRQHFAPDAHASGLPGITTHFSAVQRARQSFPPGRRQLLAAGSTWDHNAVLRATSLRLRAQGALHLRTDGREHFVPPRGIRAVSTPFTSARGSGDTTVRIWNPSSSAGTDGDLDDTIPEHIEAVEWVLALASSRMSLRSV